MAQKILSRFLAEGDDVMNDDVMSDDVMSDDVMFDYVMIDDVMSDDIMNDVKSDVMSDVMSDDGECWLVVDSGTVVRGVFRFDSLSESIGILSKQMWLLFLYPLRGKVSIWHLVSRCHVFCTCEYESLGCCDQDVAALPQADFFRDAKD